MKKQIVIGVCGAKGVGKDTFSRSVLSKNENFIIIHFADTLKEQCSVIFEFPLEYCHDEKLKELPLPMPLNMDAFIDEMKKVTGLDNIKPAGKTAYTYRQIMQYYGTDYIREADDQYWVKTIKSIISSTDKNVLVSDLRFPNEEAALREFNCLVVRLERAGVRLDPTHPSESESLKIKEDFCFRLRDGDLEQLSKVADIFAFNSVY